MDAYIIGTTSKAISSGGTINGNLTISGDLTVSGGGALAFDEILEGTQVIDITNSEAFLVRKNGDGGDVFTVNTSTVGATLLGALTIGSDGSGHDVIFYSGTSGDNLTWDASEEVLQITGTNGATALDVLDGDVRVVDTLYFYDRGGESISSNGSILSIAGGNEIDLTATAIDVNGTIDVSGNAQLSGTVTVGADGSGTDVIFYSGTAGDNFTWDASEEKLTITGTNGQTALDIADGNLVVADSVDIEGDIDVNGTTNLDAVDIDGNVQLDGTFTVGTAGSGQDVVFHSDTSGDNLTWDSSAEKLTITGTNGQTALDVADGNLVVADNIDLEGDIDVNGTANLDAVDIDGAVQLDATLSVGVDGTGYDVKFFGDTATYG